MKKFRNIVVKIGSSTLTNKAGNLDTANLKRIAGELAGLVRSGKNVTVVTSGAIVSGSDRLKFNKKPKTILEKQVAAAVGQSLLMREYAKAFDEHGITVAQILLTRDEVSHKERYTNTKNTLSKLIKMGVVPIVNENDTVSVEEIKIGDNDNLSAIVARLIEADLLIMLTDVDGFMIKGDDGKLRVVHEINEISRKIKDAAGHPSTHQGVGGMITKLQAAQICLDAGVAAAIANGRTAGVMAKVIAGGKAGTMFRSKGSRK